MVISVAGIFHDVICFMQISVAVVVVTIVVDLGLVVSTGVVVMVGGCISGLNILIGNVSRRHVYKKT